MGVKKQPFVLYILQVSIFLFSSLLLRFTDDTFDPELAATIGLANIFYVIMYFAGAYRQ